MNKYKGFTLIELLVVVAIIGMLATTTVVALNNVRQWSRDTKRTADIRQFGVALALYFGDTGLYPVEPAGVVLGSSNYSCFDEDGFVAICDAGGKTYIGVVPKNPTPGGTDYIYTSADGTTYTISITLEKGVGDYSAGFYTFGPSGVE